MPDGPLDPPEGKAAAEHCDANVWCILHHLAEDDRCDCDCGGCLAARAEEEDDIEADRRMDEKREMER
jgi:hypothetical protein